MDLSEQELIERAAVGDRPAADILLRRVERQVYNLSLRYLFEPEDARDATQDILLLVFQKLEQFRGESRLSTWVYRLATNYLLNCKRGRYEGLTIQEGLAELAAGMAHPASQNPDSPLLELEVKLGCTTSLLVCLSRPLRLAYILGEIMELEASEAAEVLAVDAATYRKRLSLARKRVRDFFDRQCGILNPGNACRCARQIGYNLQNGWLHPDNLRFATADALQAVASVDAVVEVAALYRSHPEYQVPAAYADAIRGLMQEKLPWLFTSSPAPVSKGKVDTQ